MKCKYCLKNDVEDGFCLECVYKLRKLDEER